MALLEDLAKNPTPAGLAVGLGAALIAPFLIPAVSRGVRPAVKAALSSGIALYRNTVEPVSAAIGGLITEAQLELAAARSAESTTTDDRRSFSAKGQKGHAAKHG
jgi:hypothetical protein